MAIASTSDLPPVSVTTPSRVRGDAGLALLGLCVVGLVARLTLFLRQRGDGAYAEVDAAAAAEIAIVGLTLLALVVSGPRLVKAARDLVHRSGGLWLLYFALGILTAFQSLNVSYSLFRATEGFSQALAVAVIIAAAPSFRVAERMAMGLGWCALLLDFAGRLKFSGFSLTELSSNSYSAAAAMLVCYSWGEALEARGRRQAWLWVSTFGALVLLLVGLSLASWWGALCGLLLAGLVLRPSLPIVFLLLGLLLLVIGWGPEMLEAVVLRNRSVTEISTFHGRLVLWAYYWEAFLQKPWLGYGFAIGARMNTDIYTTHTHNAILGALLGLGVPGFAMQVWSFMLYLHEVAWSRRLKSPGWVGCTAALICAFVNSMAFALIGEGWMPSTVVFAAFLMLHSLHVARRPPVAPRP
ncbi:MAG: O-antigen ligase family protein [Lentisphaerae bacterium]|nr:O-antigen ligase family protein [Lentisphaerota bacterium]